MWALAAAASAPPETNLSIVIAIIGLLSGVLVAVATGVFSLLSAKQNRTAPAPPAPTADGRSAGHWHDEVSDIRRDVSFLRERVAVVEQRSDDTDEVLDIQDRRLDHIERAKDRDHPGWRALQ